MQYVGFVGTGGAVADEAVAIMNRDFPAYFEEMDRRGVRLFGRELELPEEMAVTVRVRDGETLVTDGLFAETKEFVGGFDLLDCADLDEAIEVESASPVARFLPLEIRPVREGLLLGGEAPAFGRFDDSRGTPYLFSLWADRREQASLEQDRARAECADWRRDLDARGDFALAAMLGGPETATTLRARDGKMELSDGPFLDAEAFITGLEVVRCAGRQAAIDLAATHPLARQLAIEVRPFYTQAAHPEPEACSPT